MLDKNEINSLYEQILDLILALEKKFNVEGKKVTYFYLEASKKKPYSIFDMYNLMVGKLDSNYKEYKDKLEANKKIREHIFIIEKAYYNYIRKYDYIKDFVQNHLNESHNSVDRNTTRRILIKLDRINEQILRIINYELSSEYNDYYKLQVILEEKLFKVKHFLGVILNIIYQISNFKRKVDYKKIKKINFYNVEPGDIILFDEYEFYKSSLARRQISFWVKSTLLHSAIFFKRFNKENLIFESSGSNRRKTFIDNLILEKGVKYIILRPKKNFSKAELKKMETEVIKGLDQEFSIVKLYGVAFTYFFLGLYKNWFPFITQGENIVKGKGVFCSESISKIYLKLNRPVSNKVDLNLVSPTDVFNSFNLDVVGYMEVEKK